MDNDDNARSGATPFGWAVQRPLPRHEVRIVEEVTPTFGPKSTGGYLLEQLAYHLTPLMPAMEEPLSYARLYDEHHRAHEFAAEESGVLLLDRWSKRSLGGVRLYLRREGYALLWREEGDLPGEWCATLRHLRLPGAVATFGGNREIAAALNALGRRVAALTASPLYKKRAGEVSRWCLDVARLLRKR